MSVKVMPIATGEETEELETDRVKSAAAELGARGGKARAKKLTPGQQLGRLGGAARARLLTPEKRAEIARKAAAKRWER